MNLWIASSSAPVVDETCLEVNTFDDGRLMAAPHSKLIVQQSRGLHEAHPPVSDGINTTLCPHLRLPRTQANSDNLADRN